MRQNISSIARLQSLPVIFRGADLTVRFQWTSKTASQYLYLWKQRELVAPFGGHSDVFANLLMSPRPDWEQALVAAMPSAVAIGVDALRRAGWTTQVPQRPVVAVRADHTVYATTHFAIDPRPAAWFAATRGGRADGTRHSLPVLAPAWALADLLRDSAWGAFGLWPDDIEWDEVTAQDQSQWQAARRAFGLPDTDLMALAEASRGHAPSL